MISFCLKNFMGIIHIDISLANTRNAKYFISSESIDEKFTFIITFAYQNLCFFCFMSGTYFICW